MKLVAVTRILNEDDIVEAFVRHHAPWLDHHLFLDNGSNDRTLDILHALKAEGVALTVLQCATPFFNEIDVNTNLHLQAVRSFAADWVLFLDTDEFIDTRRAPMGLRALLAAIPPDQPSLSILSVIYRDSPHDDPADLLVPRRLQRRGQAPVDPVHKVFVRGALAGHVTIDAGQHRVELPGGATLLSPVEDRLALAHYYRRGPWHAVTKNVMGRLKALAAGDIADRRQFSNHYTGTFEAIRDRAEELLREPTFLQPDYATDDLVPDPIAYQGGPLRYTEPSDGPMKAIRMLAHYGERLARHAGRLLDASPALQSQAKRDAATWTRLF